MGLYTSIAMAVVGGISAWKQGQAAKANAEAQARIAEYNARVQEENARAIEMKTKFDQIRAQRRGQYVMGKLKAKLGWSGALMGTGAPVAVLGAQATENALQGAIIGYGGMTEAARARSGAGLSRMQADIYSEQAKNLGKASWFGAGTAALGSFASSARAGAMGEEITLFGRWGIPT